MVGTIFLGAVLKGAIGMGLPLIATPTIAVATDVPTSIAIVAIPIVLSNMFQVVQFRRTYVGAVYLPLFLTAAGLGAWFGTGVLVSAPVELLQIALGVAVLIYLAAQAVTRPLMIAPPLVLPLAAPFGFATGVLQGSLGVSSPVSVTYLQAIRLGREAFVGAISSIFLATAVVQMVRLVLNGTLDAERATLGGIGVLPIALGMALGNRLGRRVSPETFRRLVYAMLFAIACVLIADGLSG